MLSIRLLLASSLILTGCSTFESSTTQSEAATSTKDKLVRSGPAQIKHTVCFAKNSAALPADVGDTIVPHSRHLIINPYTRVLAEGMANDYESFEENQALGLRRAEAVKKVLVSLGVDPDQIIVRSSANLRMQSEQKPERNRCVVLSY